LIVLRARKRSSERIAIAFTRRTETAVVVSLGEHREFCEVTVEEAAETEE